MAMTDPSFGLGAHLELLAGMAQDFASSLDISATLGNALARITAHVGAEGGAIFLLEAPGDALACHACHGPVELTGLRLAADEGVVGRCVRRNAPEMIRDALNDPNFAPRIDRTTGFTTRSILCAPLTVADGCLGAIELVNKQGGDGLFVGSDLHLLAAMASAAALALANARLAADLVRREREHRELELAAEIQRDLLPSPRPAPFPVAGLTRPARVVSGDFFDFVPLERDRVAFAVGDVSGKGMQAAVLMAKTASLYRYLVKTEATPGRLLYVLNDEISATATRGMFVTLVVGVYDAASGRVCLANAGHEPPLLCPVDGPCRTFPAQAPPVGIAADVIAGDVFPEEDIALDEGTLYICTDGITDARTAAGAPLGTDGLCRLIAAAGNARLPDRLLAIVRGVAQEPLRDDLTLLAVDGRSTRGRE